ncbi:hypothetical protein ACVOMT_11035 [Sphingomonas panni]
MGDIRRRLTLTEDALPAGVTARWWVINRLRLCTPRFGVRDPVRYGDIGFVVVEARSPRGALCASAAAGPVDAGRGMVELAVLGGVGIHIEARM